MKASSIIANTLRAAFVTALTATQPANAEVTRTPTQTTSQNFQNVTQMPIKANFENLSEQYPQDPILKDWNKDIREILDIVLDKEQEFFEELDEDYKEYYFYGDLYTDYLETTAVFAQELKNNDLKFSTDPITAEKERLCIYQRIRDYSGIFSEKLENYLEEAYDIELTAEEKALDPRLKTITDLNNALADKLEDKGINPSCAPALV